jgi:hypothetical protein
MGVPPFGQEHADLYRETDGEEGHDWHAETSDRAAGLARFLVISGA